MDAIKRKNNSLIDISNINEKVYQLLKKRIIDRTYPPGYKLTIRELQNTFGVSNSPIKDALFKLAGEGFIDITSRKGTFVKEITLSDVLEIEQIRIIIESGAVEVVAQNITDEELADLDAFYRDTLMQGEKFNYIRFMEKDFIFHNEIIRLTKNKRLLQIYEQLNAHLQIARYRAVHNIKDRLPWTNDDHLEILQSLQMGDPEKAKKAITQHRIKARDVFLKRESAAMGLP